jgi:hypothetical protein
MCTVQKVKKNFNIGALSTILRLTIWHAWGWLVSVPALTDAQQTVTFTVNNDKNTYIIYLIQIDENLLLF